MVNSLEDVCRELLLVAIRDGIVAAIKGQEPEKLSSGDLVALTNRLQELLYSQIIPIDRTKPFSPAKFIREGWTIWKGPKNGNGLSGADAQDERSLALTEVNLTAVQFKTMLRGREGEVNGETKLKRFKKVGYIRLDAGIFQTLWENQHLIPESWKTEMTANIMFIYFDGTVLRDENGERRALCLYWCDGAWYWDVDYLDRGFSVDDPSAVLESQPSA